MSNHQPVRLSPDEQQKLLVYIAYLLQRYNRQHMADPLEVYDECFLRYLLARHRNQNFDCKLAWMKGVALNYVFYELYRVERRQGQTYDPQVLQELQTQSQLSTPAPIDELIKSELIKEALASLSQSDQTLLMLHYLQGLPWNEIQQYYSAQGDFVSQSTLRQRHSRAYNRLLEKLIKLWND
jgi:DNA-directed RNA polymerase specialized sigma24 family protein